MKHAGKKPGNGRGRRITAITVTAMVGLVGAVLIGVGARGEAPPPSPPASEAIADTPTAAATGSGTTDDQQSGSASIDAAPPTSAQPSSTTAAPSSSPAPKPQPTQASEPKLLKRSTPVHLDIPSIDVDTALIKVGLRSDGTIGVPPLDPDSPAGWYKRGPSPGEKGPAVLLGHVTALNEEGPAVFFKLGDLRKHDKISVTRADGQVAVFKVTRIVQVAKTDFSSADTYGNTEGSELRVITCGGTFNKSTGRHHDNIVVHAELVSTHPVKK